VPDVRERAVRSGKSGHTVWISALTLMAAVASARADLRREAEPNDSISRAQPIVPATSLGGVISIPGDVDIYAVRVEAGQTLSADILARGFRAGASPGSQLSAVLEILDTDGTTILAQDQSLGDFDDPTVAFQVTVTGKYFISVQELSPTGGGPGYVYVLSVELDPNDTFTTATPVVPPVLLSIDALIYPPGDVDNYQFFGRAGQILTADIDAAVFNPAQPAAKMVLRVYDPRRTFWPRTPTRPRTPTIPTFRWPCRWMGSTRCEHRSYGATWAPPTLSTSFLWIWGLP